MAVGEPRTTADAGFDVRTEVELERLATTGAMRFRRGRFQIDLITASLPFEETAYGPASVHELFGIRLPFPSPEDLILLKVLAGRDKDMLDATGVVRGAAEPRGEDDSLIVTTGNEVVGWPIAVSFGIVRGIGVRHDATEFTAGRAQVICPAASRSRGSTRRRAERR